MLTRMMRDRSGELRELNIGITGVVPPQVALWNRAVLRGALEFGGTVAAVAREAQALRAAGADLVVVLAHGGLGGEDTDAGAAEGENTALAIARLPHVDAVIAGHTHDVFPDGCDCVYDMTSAPIVQPGSNGSHLGCIDLALELREKSGSEDRWQVVRTRTEAIPVTTDPPTASLPFAGFCAEIRACDARCPGSTARHGASPGGRSARRRCPSTPISA
jgi:2',3'-cyclic-nucleotide 2'-phosphodiesterase/3'-nucleotidase